MVNRSAPRMPGIPLRLALCAWAGSVVAQGNPPAVEEVTVTARKRAESSQNVDISITVIGADDINSLRLRNLPEVAAYSQNVALFEDFPGAGIPTWFIRGVGLQDFNSNNTPTAGIYVDGNYQVATVMGTSSLYDVSQVEILKGPQGGLYGRNTSGGAVLVNSNRARLNQQEASVQLGYGSWDQAIADGMINIPLGEQLAWRLAGRVENSSDGWQKSIGSNDAHGEKDRWDARSWMTWESGNGFSAQWKLQGGADDSDIALGRSIGLYGSTELFCAAAKLGNRDDDNCINYGGKNRLARGLAPEKLSLQADDGSLVFSDPLNRQNNDYVNTVLDLRWSAGELEFVSISAYDDFSYGVALDLDGSRGEYGHRFSGSDIKVISQEFRLQSVGSNDFNWMLGVALSDEEFSERRDFYIGDNRLVQLWPGPGRLVYDQDTRSRSVYADVSYKLSARWTVNSSIRYTDEEKKYRNGSFYLALNTPVYLTRNLSANYSLDEPWSGSLGLSFVPQDDTLLYAKVSQGFKSGGFYGGFTFNPLDVAPYREETIVAWEAGLKKSWPEHALNLAAGVFHYDYQDVQGFVNKFVTNTGTAIDRLENQGDARHDGVELDLDWQPSDQVFLKAGLGWLNAEFDGVTVLNTNVAGKQVAIDGDRPYAPEWSANFIGKYAQRVGADRSVEWVMGYNFRSEFSGQQTSLIDEAVNKLPGYGVVDFSATLKRDSSGWDLTLWVKNMMDKAYRTRVKSDGLNSFVEFFGEPRSAGITALYRFSE